jgi:hypothetical protein
MRAAASPSASVTTKPSTKARASTNGRDIGGKVERGIGFAFGWLILFPVFMGLMAGVVSWFFGSDFQGFQTAAVAVGGLAFVFALFAGVAIVGFRLFLALWPVLIVGAVIAIVVTKLLG